MGYRIQKIYVGTHQVRPAGRQPTSSTLLYLPLENNLNDPYNSITASASSWITFTTQDWVACAYSNDNYAVYLLDIPNDHTSCCWVKTDFDGNWMVYWCEDNILDPIPGASNSGYTFQPTLNASWTYYFYDKSDDYATSTTYTAWWTLVTLTKSWTTVKMYKNSTLIWTWTVAQNFTEKRLQLFTRDVTSQRFKWWASNLIVENKVWTDQEISNYYDQTKWNYWH